MDSNNREREREREQERHGERGDIWGEWRERRERGIDEGLTCSGGGVCSGPQSSTTSGSNTQAPQTSSTGSAASASATPGDGGLRMMELSISPVFGLLLLLIPFGLLL